MLYKKTPVGITGVFLDIIVLEYSYPIGGEPRIIAIIVTVKFILSSHFIASQ